VTTGLFPFQAQGVKHQNSLPGTIGAGISALCSREQRRRLAVVGSQLKHSVAAGGIPVVTAGSGLFWANGRIAKLNNDTGHYQTSVESLERVRQAWMDTGLVDSVEFKERIDYQAVLLGAGKKKKGWF
jgi:hypothetical protein